MKKVSSYDSEFCGSLPLHLVNFIQPYGYLIVLRKSDLSVIQVSENIAKLFDCPIKSIINTSFFDLLNPDESERLRGKLIAEYSDRIPLPLSITFNNISYDLLALIHFKNDLIILELEILNAAVKNSFISVYQNLRHSVHAIEKERSLTEVSNAVLRELKKISGFDKVMMYQFDENWNGTVIAEDNDEEFFESYLGLTFPASDIPKQARELYLKNSYRLIPEREYSPVGLYPVINPVTNSFLDLSDCNLRSVPKVHLEYLKNMNVRASMSIRVLKDDKLWGLISCHSNTPKYLNYELCSVFELLSNIISNKISSIIAKEEFNFTTRLNEGRSRLIDQIYMENDLFKGLLNLEHNINQLLDTTGAAVVYENRIETIGDVPDREFIDNLVYWLQAKKINKTHFELNLAEQFEQAADHQDIASGIIVITINQEKGEYIIGFRPEQEQTISWGGNPNEAINFEADNKTYHPRNSFKLWKETVKQTCKAWEQSELDVAERFRSFLYEFTTR